MVNDLPDPCVCQMMPLRSRGLAFEQSLDRELDGAELLVTADDLDRLALVVGREERERADQVEQVVAVEHAGHEPLLVVRAAGTVVQVIDRFAVRVGPAVEILFGLRRDRAELRLLPAGRR